MLPMTQPEAPPLADGAGRRQLAHELLAYDRLLQEKRLSMEDRYLAIMRRVKAASLTNQPT